MATDNSWWRGATIYQIYPRSFFDTNCDGIGDLPGITAKLDYVASLGVDAIWLCPYYTSPQRDFGYDVADYLSVDPLFGTLEDFDELITTAHSLGLRVLIDQVWSHTSDHHPWFLQSRCAADNDKSDWYVWADPSADGTPPNNWLSVFGGSAWTWEPRRRQFYLHHFLSSQPSLNFHNPAVLDAVIETGRYWLDRGVDGFRLDAIDFLTHDPRLCSNPAAKPWGGITPAKPFALQQHDFDMLHPSRMDVVRRIRALLDEYPGTVSLGEVSSQPGAFGRVMDYTTDNDRLHMAYTLSPMRGSFDWQTVRNLLRDVHAAGEAGWACWSFSNHDTERAVSRWNPQRDTSPPDQRFARLLVMLLLCMRGTICFYQGEELGLTEAKLTFDQLRDPFGIAYWPEFRGRDGSRTPMPWVHDLPHGNFTHGEASWLPIPGDHYTMAVNVQNDDPNSLLNFWRDALEERRQHPALITGSLTPIDLPEPLIGFIRESAEERLTCVFNLSDQTVSANVPGLDEIAFEPYGCRIFEMEMERV